MKSLSVLRPFSVDSVELPNRIVFPAFQTNYANDDGTVSKKLHAFYTRMASGGCGLIFTGAAVVSPESVAFDRVMRIDSDRCVPGLINLFSNIAERGSVPGIQLIHYGRQALNAVTGHDLPAPSAIPCPVMSQFDPGYRVVEMTCEDIERVRADFINAAVRSAEAGAKVIEVHAAHGYLLNQFLSPYSNFRTDAYGGSPENRLRLIREIVEGIRGRLSNSIALSVRVSASEYVKAGLAPPDFKFILPQLETAGIDMVNVSAGVYESMDRIVPPKSLGTMPHVPIAAELKQYSTIPVCTVGSVTSLEMAEDVVASGKADLVAMGRAQVADPEIIRKTAEGRADAINGCRRCNECTFWTNGDPYMFCAVNPELRK